MIIIDAHCHYGKGNGQKGLLFPKLEFNKYVERAKIASISKTVIFPMITSDYERANEEVAAKVFKNPPRYIGFAMLHPIRDKNRIEKLIRKAVLNYSFCGIKVHRHDGRITHDICKVAEYYSLPILYDPMDELAPVENMAVNYPNVSFIIPHLGSFGDNWRVQRSMVRLLKMYDNLYTDSSAVRRFDNLQNVIDYAGADKMIFGSDGPWLHPNLELSKIYALSLNQEELEKVLSGNILRLIRKNYRLTRNH